MLLLDREVAVPELNVEVEARERRALEDVGRVVNHIRDHLKKVLEEASMEAKIDRSLIQQWVTELSVPFPFLEVVDDHQEPSDEWTYEDRWLVVLWVRREMETFLQASIPSFVTEFQAKRWLTRIEMAVCLFLCRDRLEAHRRELLGSMDPII